MIQQHHLDQIKQFLDLEKISVTQKIIVNILPKKQDSDFSDKLISVKKELKKKNIELRIIEEGEIDDVKSIDLF